MPEFTNQQLSDHDLLVKLADFQDEVIKPTFDKLDKGEIGTCVSHNERLTVCEKRIDSWGLRSWSLVVMLLGSIATNVWNLIKH